MLPWKKIHGIRNLRLKILIPELLFLKLMSEAYSCRQYENLYIFLTFSRTQLSEYLEYCIGANAPIFFVHRFVSFCLSYRIRNYVLIQVLVKIALYSLVYSSDKFIARLYRMLKIKDFATLCGCSIYTLRYYDQIDLLKPSIVNDNSGYRYYTEDQLLKFIEIKEFQEIGFRVEEIKKLEKLDQKEVSKLILEKIDYLQSRLDKSITLLRKYID